MVNGILHILVNEVELDRNPMQTLEQSFNYRIGQNLFTIEGSRQSSTYVHNFGNQTLT